MRGTEVLEHYCDEQLQVLYRRLGLGKILTEPLDGAQVARRLRFVDSADVTMHALLYRLARRTDVVGMHGEGLQAGFLHQHEPPDPAPRLAELRAQMAGLGEDYAVGLDFLDFGVEHFERALRDDPELLDRMLSGREGELAGLWHAATNVDPLQDLHGAMGAEVLAGSWRGGVAIELGGGTGNGIRHLLRRLEAQNALGRVEHYVFTDISVRFLMQTRTEIKARWPDVPCAWTFIDLNQPLTSFRVPTEGVDLIYAVNAAHVAKDIVAFLRECYALLRAGGRVVFSERVRMDPYQMAPRELTLNLSIYHRSAALRTAQRPMHCYLSPDGWRSVLTEAGFRPQLLPDLDGMAEHFAQQYAAVIVGHKDD